MEKIVQTVKIVETGFRFGVGCGMEANEMLLMIIQMLVTVNTTQAAEIIANRKALAGKGLSQCIRCHTIMLEPNRLICDACIEIAKKAKEDNETETTTEEP